MRHGQMRNWRRCGRPSVIEVDALHEAARAADAAPEMYDDHDKYALELWAESLELQAERKAEPKAALQLQQVRENALNQNIPVQMATGGYMNSENVRKKIEGMTLEEFGQFLQTTHPSYRAYIGYGL
jgi:hypothetical protein